MVGGGCGEVSHQDQVLFPTRNREKQARLYFIRPVRGSKSLNVKVNDNVNATRKSVPWNMASLLVIAGAIIRKTELARHIARMRCPKYLFFRDEM